MKLFKFILLLSILALCTQLTTAQYMPFGFWKSNSDPCPGGTWTQSQYFKAPNASGGDAFGTSVSVWGDTVVVGAPKEESTTEGVFTSTAGSNQNDSGPDNRGAVYVYHKSGSTWSLQAYIKPVNGDNADNFGSSISLYEDTLAIGAPHERSNSGIINGTGTSPDNTIILAGAVYIYKRSGTTWTQEAFIKPDDPDSGDKFGTKIRLYKDQLVVSSKFEDSDSNNINHWPTGGDTGTSAAAAGAAYVFKRTGVTWAQVAYLKADNSAGNDNYSDDVFIDENTIVVGSFRENSTNTGVFPNASGANNSGANNGAAYVYTKNTSTGVWSQQAYIKSDNNDDNDHHGDDLAIDGNTMAVGAFKEKSNQTTVTTTGSANDSGDNRGAVYVYKRTGTAWAMTHYIKAPNGDNDDFFGGRVGIYKNRIAIGAEGEASNQTSITATASSDNSNAGSGAIYVFKNSGSTWALEAYIKPDNSEANDDFSGEQIDFKKNQIIVGAIGEDSSQTTNSASGAGDNSRAGSGAAYLFECN